MARPRELSVLALALAVAVPAAARSIPDRMPPDWVGSWLDFTLEVALPAAFVFGVVRASR